MQHNPPKIQKSRFYGLYAVFEDIGWQLNREVEIEFKDTNRMILEETLQSEINVLDDLQKLGPTVIDQLDSLRNTPIPSSIHVTR